MSARVPVLATRVDPTILGTILGRLAVLFLSGANGDLSIARDAAMKSLTAYHPETETELRLAAEIISFSFHALEALSQAATLDMPLTKILRLRGSAVSLSRESHKSQRRLDQMQRNRGAGIPAKPTTRPEPSRPRIEKALASIATTRDAMAAGTKDGDKTWTQRYRERATAKRLAARLRKNQSAQVPTQPFASATPAG